ncbi:MAG: hypothetical protein GC179_12710 [Anaerolineaceae bacterium]|nr:hypothetical protein [Anaerolineaceae bacterium]
MTDLEAILQAIDALPQADIEQVQKHVIERQQQLEAVEAKITALNTLVENFWEGFSEAEVEQIIADINSEYVEMDSE